MYDGGISGNSQEDHHEEQGYDPADIQSGDVSGMVRFIIRILKGTVLVEGIGAVLFAFHFVPEYGFIKGVAYGIFILFLHFVMQELTCLALPALWSM